MVKNSKKQGYGIKISQVLWNVVIERDNFAHIGKTMKKIACISNIIATKMK